MAGYDPARAKQVFKWPVREALLAFENKLKKEAQDQYIIETLLWGMWVPYGGKDVKQPKLPEILKR